MDENNINSRIHQCRKSHRLLPVILFLCYSLFSVSQINDTAFYSDFSKKENCFPAEETNRGSTFCSNGKYVMKHLDSTGKSWRQTVLVPFNPLHDFSIETLVSMPLSGRNSSVGLAFGYKDPENGNYFIFDAEGSFMIVQMNSGVVDVIKPFTYTAALKNPEEPNQLRVEMKNGSCSFFINQNKVAESNEIKMYDARVGFYEEGKTTIEAEYLLVAQKKAGIHLFPLWEGFGKKEQLGAEINTIYGEKHPIISPDGQFLYVNREDNPFNTDGPKEDVWFSELKNGKWTHMKNLGYPINNRDYNYIAGISADNSLLLLGNVYNKDLKSMREGFSISYKTKKGWGIPQEVRIDNYYNNNKFNGACISADKKVIVMTVERKDTHGEKDLYVCFMKKDSSWTEPQNMGPVVNSWAAEFGPYLAPDGKTLYYSSFGLPGYGEADLFVTTRLDDSWTNWSEPMNLGPKINTKFWDGYFSVSAAGDYAYISSTEHGRADLDAYRIKMPQLNAKLKLLALDKNGMKPIEANFVIRDGKSLDTLGKGKSVAAFDFECRYTGCVELSASCKGYFAERKTIEIDYDDSGKEKKEQFLLTPFTKGTTLVLNTIAFKPNEAELLEQSYAELNKLASALAANPGISIEVAGHTSRTAEGEAFNLQLSGNRALAVKRYLEENGIDGKRILAKGYGYQKPLFVETDEEHQARNRRVEITVLTE